MDSYLFVRVAITLLLCGVILWIAWSTLQDYRYNRKHHNPTQEKETEITQQIQLIIERGGPKDLQEYLVLFPQACRRCGSRVFFEKMSTKNTFSQLPLGSSSYVPERLWACIRCGLGNAPNLENDPEARIYTVTSPYLDRQIAQAIEEFPYEAEEVEEGSEALFAKPELRVEGASREEFEQLSTLTKASIYLVNDDVTPMDFVVFVLINIFRLSGDQAMTIMNRAHNEGECLIRRYTFIQAQEHAMNAIKQAHEHRYPLSFIIRVESADKIR